MQMLAALRPPPRKNPPSGLARHACQETESALLHETRRAVHGVSGTAPQLHAAQGRVRRDGALGHEVRGGCARDAYGGKEARHARSNGGCGRCEGWSEGREGGECPVGAAKVSFGESGSEGDAGAHLDV